MSQQPYLLRILILFILRRLKTHLAHRILITVINLNHMVLFCLFPGFLLVLVFLMMPANRLQLLVQLQFLHFEFLFYQFRVEISILFHQLFEEFYVVLLLGVVVAWFLLLGE